MLCTKPWQRGGQDAPGGGGGKLAAINRQRCGSSAHAMPSSAHFVAQQLAIGNKADSDQLLQSALAPWRHDEDVNRHTMAAGNGEFKLLPKTHSCPTACRTAALINSGMDLLIYKQTNRAPHRSLGRKKAIGKGSPSIAAPPLIRHPSVPQLIGAASPAMQVSSKVPRSTTPS